MTLVGGQCLQTPCDKRTIYLLWSTTAHCQGSLTNDEKHQLVLLSTPRQWTCEISNQGDSIAAIIYLTPSDPTVRRQTHWLNRIKWGKGDCTSNVFDLYTSRPCRHLSAVLWSADTVGLDQDNGRESKWRSRMSFPNLFSSYGGHAKKKDPAKSLEATGRFLLIGLCCTLASLPKLNEAKLASHAKLKQPKPVIIYTLAFIHTSPV